MGWTLICGAALREYRDKHSFKAASWHLQRQQRDEEGQEVGSVAFGGNIQQSVNRVLSALLKDIPTLKAQSQYITVASTTSTHDCTASTSPASAYSSSSSSSKSRRFYLATACKSQDTNQEKPAKVKWRGHSWENVTSSENILTLEVHLAGQSKYGDSQPQVFMLSARDPRLSNEVESGLPWAFQRVLQMSKDAYLQEQSNCDRVDTHAIQLKLEMSAPKRSNKKSEPETRRAGWIISTPTARQNRTYLEEEGAYSDIGKTLGAAARLSESALADAVVARTASLDVLPPQQESQPQPYDISDVVRQTKDRDFYAEMALCAPTRACMRKAALLAQSSLLEKNSKHYTAKVMAPTEVRRIQQFRYTRSRYPSPAVAPPMTELDADDGEPWDIDISGVAAAVAGPNAGADELAINIPHTQRETALATSIAGKLSSIAGDDTRKRSRSACEALTGSLDASAAKAVWVTLEEVAKTRLIEWYNTGAMLPAQALTRTKIKGEVAEQLQGASKAMSQDAFRQASTLLFGPPDRVAEMTGVPSNAYNRFIKFSGFEAARKAASAVDVLPSTPAKKKRGRPSKKDSVVAAAAAAAASHT
jgi:hypothetical protein